MTTTRENGSLYTSIENNMGIIEFGHPASNSFPGVLLDRLEKAICKYSDQPEVKVILRRFF